MHEADHAYSIWSTWWLHRSATDVPTIHNLCYQFAKYFCLQLGSVELSVTIWTVVFFIFMYLSPVSLFCARCRMSQLWFVKILDFTTRFNFDISLSKSMKVALKPFSCKQLAETNLATVINVLYWVSNSHIPARNHMRIGNWIQRPWQKQTKKKE